MSTKISQLTSAVDVTANDLIQIVDVEDGVMAPSGTNKKATASLLAKELAKQPLEPGIVISGSSSSDAVRITQTGSGNALVVEDSTNPDATPFVVNNQGFVLVGDTTSRTGPYGYQRGLQLTNAGTQLTAAINNEFGEGIVFAKGRGTPSSPHTIVQLGDALGSIAFTGSDGSNYVLGSQIASFVDAAPGSGDMPSCLAFNTSSDGTTNAAERMRITSAGNVGIGTSSPSEILHARKTVAAGPVVSKIENPSATSGSSARFDMATGSANSFAILAVTDSAAPYTEWSAGSGVTGGTYITSATTSAPIVLRQAASERLRINSAGNVGIGTSSPSYQLELSTDSAAKPSTSTWTVSSDERLKENIEAADLDICYNAVKSIPLKRYTWKDEIYSAEQVADRSKIGWIAQDVQAVFPKAVDQHKFVYNQVKDEEGNIVSEDSIDDCLSLNSDQLYAALFGAVQKLMGEVESLQDRIAELESAP